MMCEGVERILLEINIESPCTSFRIPCQFCFIYYVQYGNVRYKYWWLYPTKEMLAETT